MSSHDLRNGRPYRRNRGAVLLSSSGETQDAISAATKISRVEVSYFMSGRRIPGPLNRTKLWKGCKIPVRAWDEEPDELTEAETVPGEPVAAGPSRTRQQIDKIRAASLSDKRTTRREKLAELKAIILLEGIVDEKEVIDEKRLLESPALVKVVGKLLKALEPWPDAMKAAGAALKGGGNE